MALREDRGRIVTGILSIITEMLSLVLMLTGRERKCLADHIASTVILRDPANAWRSSGVRRRPRSNGRPRQSARLQADADQAFTERSHGSATMPCMTLFDVSGLSRWAEAGRTPAARSRRRRGSAPARAPARETGRSATVPEVEVRISARRKKTSEAKWDGGRIVVSLPAHLDVESRQKTVDWLVQRLLTRHRLQSSLSDDDLLPAPST